jgi:hypothetical protein
MPKCDFTINIGNKINEPRKLLKNELAERGGHISFNSDGDSEGKFNIVVAGVGKISGNLIIRDEEIYIEITNKPFLLPCGTIKSVVKSYM